MSAIEGFAFLSDLFREVARQHPDWIERAATEGIDFDWEVVPPSSRLVKR